MAEWSLEGGQACVGEGTPAGLTERISKWAVPQTTTLIILNFILKVYNYLEI